MHGKIKQARLRVFLLVVIAGMLGLIAAKVNVGEGAFDVFAGRLNTPQKEESASSQAKGTSASAEESAPEFAIQSPVSSSQSEEVPRTLRDGSKITRMEDGYGNSTVTRSFRGHELLRMILIRYHENGQRRVFVYGKNGQVESLPSEYYESALTATPGEIAKLAKIEDSLNQRQRKSERISVIREIQRDELRERQLIENQTDAEQVDLEENDKVGVTGKQFEPDSEE